MKARASTVTTFTAILAMVLAVLTATDGPALAGTAEGGNRASGAGFPASMVTYAVHRQMLSADGTSTWGATCPAGAFPVGGGALAGDPLVESVTQAGFDTSRVTGKFDGYRATVRVSGLPKRARAMFTVQVACVPAAVFVIYVVHTLLLAANGTSYWAVPCPVGAVPVGGGTIVQSPFTETVTQAGFHSSAMGAFDGYQAGVRVSGLPSDSTALFAVQVACVPAATPVIYGIHPSVLAVNGGSSARTPVTDDVPQSGFHTSSATGRLDGYQAGLRLSGPPREVRFAVEVACVHVATPPVYGPRVKVPASGGTVRTVTCPIGTIPLGGGTSVLDSQAPLRPTVI